MKIGSSSDWHLDSGMDVDIASSVRQMIPIFQDGKVTLIALPGDLFDRKSTPEGRNLLRQLIQELAEIAPVLICYGNHDEAGDLDIFGEVRSRFPISVHASPWIYKPGPFGPDCLIHVLPWFSKTTWQAQHAGVSKEEGDRTVSQMALDYLKRDVILHHEDGIKHILMSHLTIDGSTAENHQPMKGEGIKFGRLDLVEAGFYAGVFGHIHLAQDLLPLFFYNGSPAALNYGESPNKFCSILRTDDGVVEWHKLKTVDRFSMELNWGGINGPETTLFQHNIRIHGSRVRILLKIGEGEDVGYAKENVEKKIMGAGALEVKVEPQVQPREMVRAVEISAAETLPEKLDAYWKANNNYPEETDQVGMREKLNELECSECSS